MLDFIPKFFTEQAAIEKDFGPGALLFSTSTLAHQAVCESLGSRARDLPVVMSVASPPQAIAGVLRAGAQPLLLDISLDTLQMSPEQLQEVLPEIGSALVYLYAPGSLPVDSRLLDITKQYPTLYCAGLPFDAAEQSVATFNILSFEELTGSGVLLAHGFEDQVSALKKIRSGLLGLDAGVPNALAAEIRAAIASFETVNTTRTQVISAYSTALDKRLEEVFTPDFFTVKVKNASVCVAHLHDHGIQAVHTVCPLHQHKDLSKRWIETPEYPQAEEAFKTFLSLPTNAGVRGMEKNIIEILLEVA